MAIYCRSIRSFYRKKSYIPLVMGTQVEYSICSTHYNNKDYIRSSAGSVAREIEGRSDWEFVIVDAGSDDGSLEYLRDLADSQDNVRVVVSEGASIGKGRDIAVQKARGEKLIQLMDLDEDYFEDGRLFELAAFFDDVLETEGDVLLVSEGYLCTKTLLDDLGGWRDFAAGEETELARRALRSDRLRFCNVSLFDKSMEDERGGFRYRLRRFYNNTRTKIRSGISPLYMLNHWLQSAPGIQPRLGALVAVPIATASIYLQDEERFDSYEAHDPYILDFQKSVYRDRPELWLDPPPELAEYVDEGQTEHLES